MFGVKPLFMLPVGRYQISLLKLSRDTFKGFGQFWSMRTVSAGGVAAFIQKSTEYPLSGGFTLGMSIVRLWEVRSRTSREGTVSEIEVEIAWELKVGAV